MKSIFATILALTTFPCFAGEACFKKALALGTEEFKVEVTSYLLPSSKNHILILPPTGGSNVLDRSWARNFCAAGFNAHIVEHWTLLEESSVDLGLHQRLYGRSQKAIGLVLDHLKDAEYLGLLGTSIGGIFTAMAMGIHDRIDAAFVITAGADMGVMIANSDQQAMVDLWEKRRQELSLPDKKTYIEHLRGRIECDPLQLPKKFVGKDLGMVIATEDKTVPTENQLSPKDLWKPKMVLEYSNTHFWAIVKAWFWDTGKVVSFFQESAKKKANTDTARVSP